MHDALLLHLVDLFLREIAKCLGKLAVGDELAEVFGLLVNALLDNDRLAPDFAASCAANGETRPSVGAGWSSLRLRAGYPRPARLSG